MHTVYFWICFVIALFLKEIVTDKCHTPEMQEGECKPLSNCPKVLEAFANPPKGSETYLRQYLCKDGEMVEVCCDNSSSVMMLAEQHLIFEFPQALLNDVLPQSDDSLEDSIPSYKKDDPYDSVLPAILAKHPESGVTYVKCIGALINARYVVTGAECVVQNGTSKGSAIVGVQFTSSKKNYFFGVEEEIPHPFYDPATKINDLALIRLNGTVLEDGDRLYLSIETKYHFFEGQHLSTYDGLNLNGSTGDQWQKRKFILNKFLVTDVCRETLKNKNVSTVVTEYHICTEDLRNSAEMTCNEYAGSLLIRYFHYSNKYEVILHGISSLKMGCTDGLPNVYTNLIKYRPWLRDNMRPWLDDSEQCRTPSGDAGQSLPIYYCPALLEMFADVGNGTRSYLDKFITKQDDYSYLVCCPKLQNASIFENRNVLPKIDVPPQFLDKRCGLQRRDDYFSSSTAIAIDEFPWIASIVDTDHIRFAICGGVLINARYVLTTAMCTYVVRKGFDYDTIVRLGDYTSLSEKDCVKDVEVDRTDCTETEFFGVEDKIRHPFFIKELDLNNLGLLRLNKTVRYTDYIRPICLPVQGTVAAKPGDTLYKSGWFFKQHGGKKEKVLTILLSHSECQRLLRTFSKEYIYAGTICTRDYIYNSTLSVYIPGAALMFSNNYRWHVEGVFFAGYASSMNSPQKYTNVSKYVNWILENMRPWE